ncbi:hypothetical protein NLI96_g5531 [Meripilus lineatus]|uniref:Chromosome transmission fidelity protein 18 n=1 Tax=Meripilus lineatus TaxID=2056292 RepID=A0AAD5V3B4_9APHY|nr:hypothetical protein NLI96_g5531 [Physisporinus lineatus]
MLETESLFGAPSALLGSTSNLDSMDVEPSEPSQSSSGFVLGDLLGGPANTTKVSLLQNETAETNLGGRAEALSGNEFMANGLLSDPYELPSLSEIIRPYVANRTELPNTSEPLLRPSIRATSLSGKAVFLRKKWRRSESSTPLRGVQGSDCSRLLSIPVPRLMDSLAAQTASRLTMAETNTPLVGTSQNKDQKTAMLVDVYRPQRFIDLVGDDRVHREVLAWVKEWDFCVFGNKKGKKRQRDEENLDPYRRPQEKVFDVNASDTRTAQTVEDRIRPAIESGSSVGSSKPNLIIIDEIDGSTGGTDNSAGFIQSLIQLTLDKPRKKGRKGGPKQSCPLLRPIICICNDLYASSLTKLRPHARIVRFNRPNDVHLVRRLRTICECEGMKAESRALSTLVGLARGDMRGCLNTLQILQARGQHITEDLVRKATNGMKEADASQTSVLNDLFLPMPKKRVKDLGITEDEETRYVSRLCREIEACGSTDKIAIGCFEHYATLRKHDSNFSRYLKANEWLSSYDLMAGEMRSEREYSMLQYLSYMLVPFNPLFSERGGEKVERPKADWEHYTKTKVNEEIYKSLGKCMRTAGTRQGGAYRHLCSDEILQLEFSPYINRIISPPLRPVNSQVVKPEERAVLSRLVDIMSCLELRFIQERSEEGHLVYRLDPPIDVFMTYDGKRASDIAVSRYAVRHLVASEVRTLHISTPTLSLSTVPFSHLGIPKMTKSVLGAYSLKDGWWEFG